MESKIDIKKMLIDVFDYLLPAIIAGIVTFVLLKVFFMIAYVPSESMANTIKKNSVILANRLAYNKESPQRGDIIIFENDQTQYKYLVKRIIGVGGDKIKLENGSVFINGEKQNENYVISETYPLNNISEFEVPSNTVFVMGDNREHSLDSRVWDDPYVPINMICGKLIFS